MACLVDMRVDFAALEQEEPAVPSGLGVHPSHRLTTGDLQRFFTTAWTTATAALPLAVTTNPNAVPPAGPSTVELHIDSERAAGYGGTRVLGLPDMLDLHELGQTPAQHRLWMSAAVTAPVTLAPSEVAGLVERTLRYIASGYGYLDLDPDDTTA